VNVANDNRSVFVVHGRNEALRRSLFEFLRSINLSPMEWTTPVELAGDGSPYIGQVGSERPLSDIAGRHTVRLTNDIASRQVLAERLETAGCDVSDGLAHDRRLHDSTRTW
jgi:hypothetical protein